MTRPIRQGLLLGLLSCSVALTLAGCTPASEQTPSTATPTHASPPITASATPTPVPTTPVVERSATLSAAQVGQSVLATAVWSGRVWVFASWVPGSTTPTEPRNGVLSEFDATTGAPRGTVIGPAEPVAAVSGASGLWTANTGGDGSERSYSADTVWQITDPAHPTHHVSYPVINPIALAVTPTGAWIYSGGTDSAHAELAFLSHGQVLHHLVLANFAENAGLGFGDDELTVCGSQLVDAHAYTYVANGGTNFKATIEVRDPVTGALRTSTTLPESDPIIACSAGTTPVIGFSDLEHGDAYEYVGGGWQAFSGLPSRLDSITGTPDGFWVTTPKDDGTATAVHFAGTQQTGSIRLAKDGPVAADGEALWVAQQADARGGRLVEIDGR